MATVAAGFAASGDLSIFSTRLAATQVVNPFWFLYHVVDNNAILFHGTGTYIRSNGYNWDGKQSRNQFFSLIKCASRVAWQLLCSRCGGQRKVLCEGTQRWRVKAHSVHHLTLKVLPFDFLFLSRVFCKPTAPSRALSIVCSGSGELAAKGRKALASFATYRHDVY